MLHPQNAAYNRDLDMYRFVMFGQRMPGDTGLTAYDPRHSIRHITIGLRRVTMGLEGRIDNGNIGGRTCGIAGCDRALATGAPATGGGVMVGITADATGTYGEGANSGEVEMIDRSLARLLAPRCSIVSIGWSRFRASRTFSAAGEDGSRA